MPDAPESVLLQIAVQQKGARYLNQLDNEEPGTANYFPIVWKNGEHIEVSAEADHFQSSFLIKDPSPENAAMLELRNVRQQAFEKYLVGKKSEVHDEAGLLDTEKAWMNFRQPMMDFAQKSSFLLPALTAIRWVSIEADYERIPEFMVAQCEKWKQESPDHPWVAPLCQYGNRNVLPVLKGDAIPDFALPMLAGDTLALQQLLGRQLTILDLWASWCAPCRKENRDYLVPLWEKYQAEGLQIIGYALDASAKVWKGAIEKDGADRWLHASHLQGDDSPFFEALRIRTIPANFLLDSTGKVMAKNLHGEELVQFVEEYMERK
jgi:thiol-disulfide isomerase/thioredoxin